MKQYYNLGATCSCIPRMQQRCTILDAALAYRAESCICTPLWQQDGVHAHAAQCGAAGAATCELGLHKQLGLIGLQSC
jgi:hypothetical protein